MTIDNQPRWKSSQNERFYSKDEATQDALNHMQYKDYEERLSRSISYNNLFQWAIAQNQFWEDFSTKIHEVENDFFQENYHEMSDEEIKYEMIEEEIWDEEEN